MGMPRIEIEFEFDIVFCFGIPLAPYAVFSTRIYIQYIARPVESDRAINIVFVCPFFRSQFMNVELYFYTVFGCSAHALMNQFWSLNACSLSIKNAAPSTLGAT